MIWSRHFGFFAAFALFAAVAVAADDEGERAVRVVDVDVCVDEICDALFLTDPDEGCVCCISAVTNAADGGPARWVAFNGRGRGWTSLEGDIAPKLGVACTFRAEIDFSGKDTMIRYSVKRPDGSFAPLSDGSGREWLASPTPDKKTITTIEVGSAE